MASHFSANQGGYDVTDISLAKDLLIKEAYSLVIYKDGKIITTSREKGLKPLIDAIGEYKEELVGAVLADKIIGKAGALISIYGGISEVYAHTISDCAKDIYQSNGIKIESDRVVPYIINRDGTDKCPMEKIVENIENSEEAYNEIKRFIIKMKK